MRQTFTLWEPAQLAMGCLWGTGFSLAGQAPTKRDQLKTKVQILLGFILRRQTWTAVISFKAPPW